MAQDLNMVALIGNLTKDPELRHTAGGTAVANLRVAVNDRVKRNGEWTDTPYYFDVTVWGNSGERCAEWLSKGKKVGVQGKLVWSEWNAQDGSKRSKVEIVADRVQFLTPRSDSGSGGGGGDYGGADYSRGGGDTRSGGGESFQPASESFTSSTDDDIPF